ncbi:DedA family protein [Candidatus Woesearchaeota archaeon]|nr:DedA family protein [Candidatus Woesearchaeota archaeon]
MIIETILENFTYLAIIALLFISGVGVPMPEEPILLLGGFISAEGFTNIWLTLIAAVTGVIAGDNAGYILGRDHGERFLKTVEKRFRIPKKRVDKELKLFKEHPLKAIFIMRFLPGLKIFGPALAGYTGVKWSKYQIVNLVAVLLYVPLMILIGWYFSTNIEHVLKDVKLVKRILTIAIIIILGYILTKRMMMRQ